MTRAQVCRSAADRLLAADASTLTATIGLDGFVDEICAVVDTRTDFTTYRPIDTIADFGTKVLAAAGRSANYELVVRRTKLGGNGPIMAHALARAGAAVTYVGATGYPTPHPAFADFGRSARVIGIAEPGHTDAVEFSDGKLMLGKLEPLADVNWTNLTTRVGPGGVAGLLADARLIGMANWTMLPGMTEVWERLITDILPSLGGPRRTLFVDLADPEKRPRADLLRALEQLQRFGQWVDVVFGANLKEAVQVAEVLGVPVTGDPERQIEAMAVELRRHIGVACVVIHPRGGAAAADTAGSAHIAGPFVAAPRISTGAGDHFNAGFCLGRMLGLPLAECLATGVGTSGYYVRSGESPTKAQLAEFVGDMPLPQ